MKDSGVEWLEKVPESWDVGAARRFFLFNPSKREISTRPRSEEVSFLPMEAIGETGTLDLTRTRQIKEVETGYSYFANGDVVIAKITPCFENGKGSAIGGLVGGVGFGTTELIVLRPSRHVSQQYSWWLFSAAGFRRFAEGHMEGSAGQKRVQDDWLKAQKVAIPPRPVQDAIVAHLDRATFRIDTLVTKKTRFIELLREKRQALITHAVTKGLDPNVPMKDSGVEWLGAVPAHWNVVPPGVLFTDSKERAYPGDQMLSATQKYGVIPLAEFEAVEGRQVTKATTNFEMRKHVEIGDFVISMRSMDGGLERSHATGSVRSSYSVLKAHSEVHGPYFGLLLKCSLFIQALRLTSNFIRDGQDLNFNHVKKVKLPLPDLAEQAKIADYVTRTTTRIDTLIAKIERSIELLREHRTALITAAVTGKLDLRATA